MQLVINIPEDTYQHVINTGTYGHYRFNSARAIRNGTPLAENHGKKFEEIVVEYPPAEFCIYPEYKGKPYYSIKYRENDKEYVGFSTYSPEVLSSFLQEYFIAPTIIESKQEEGSDNE